MKHAWLVFRSCVLWAISYVHFFFAGLLALLLGAILGSVRADWFIRWSCRNIVRLAGARREVRFPEGFDKKRTCFYVGNHVNAFDPFLLCGSLPPPVRGLELESHFRIPVYGWIMSRFGNVPVPDERTAAGLKRTYRLTRESLDKGISLIVYPEAGRTLDGKLQPFEDGVFRMALQLGYPIVPVSVINAFTWKRKGSNLLRPAKVIVQVHDLIEIDGIGKKEWRGLRDRVHDIVSGPVHEALT